MNRQAEENRGAIEQLQADNRRQADALTEKDSQLAALTNQHQLQTGQLTHVIRESERRLSEAATLTNQHQLQASQLVESERRLSEDRALLNRQAEENRGAIEQLRADNSRQANALTEMQQELRVRDVREAEFIGQANAQMSHLIQQHTATLSERDGLLAEKDVSEQQMTQMTLILQDQGAQLASAEAATVALRDNQESQLQETADAIEALATENMGLQNKNAEYVVNLQLAGEILNKNKLLPKLKQLAQHHHVRSLLLTDSYKRAKDSSDSESDSDAPPFQLTNTSGTRHHSTSTLGASSSRDAPAPPASRQLALPAETELSSEALRFIGKGEFGRGKRNI